MAKKNNGLSKTSLLKGMQCKKALYLYKYHYQDRDPVSRALQDKFDRGHRVGMLARELFPGGIDCTPPTIFQYEQSIAATKALIMRQEPVIYEAAFKHEGVLVALDLLCFRDGKWYGYEVKSSIRTSRTYLLDAAIQYHVITKSGLALEDIFLVHLNGNYVRKGDVDLQQLFRITSVKDEVLEQQLDIQSAIKQAREVLSLDAAPVVDTGIHCYRPYACDFLGTCWKGLEKSPILQLAGVAMQDKIDWLKNGIRSLEEIPEAAISQGRMHAQMMAHKSKRAYIDREKLKAFFNDISYPLYFFDIEAFQPAVPLFEHTSPFQAIPFQFSAHYIERQDGPLEANEFIVQPGEDGRLAFTEAFLKATERPGQIAVFNTLLEKGILFQLGKLFPQYAGAIRDRVVRMIDLETPFRKDWYYHPGMQGGYSMKNILPAIAPDLSYDQMNVKDGQDAMHVYHQLWYEEDFVKKSRALQDLLSYCQRDTLGLYHIYRHMLHEISSE
jgi:hypothetical protein